MGSVNAIFDTKKFHQGDNATFKQLFDKYYHPITYTVAKLLGNMQEPPEDFVLFAFLKLFENRQKIETEQHARSFLFITATNKAKNFIRNFMVRQSLLTDYSQLCEHCENPLQSEHQTDITAVENGVESLPQEVKKVIKLFYYEQMPIRAIASELNLAIDTVKKYNFRGKKHLRNTLTNVKAL